MAIRVVILMLILIRQHNQVSLLQIGHRHHLMLNRLYYRQRHQHNPVLLFQFHQLLLIHFPNYLKRLNLFLLVLLELQKRRFLKLQNN